MFVGDKKTSRRRERPDISTLVIETDNLLFSVSGNLLDSTVQTVKRIERVRVVADIFILRITVGVDYIPYRIDKWSFNSFPGRSIGISGDRCAADRESNT